MQYSRILLKISGEALSGQGEKSVQKDALQKLVDEIKSAYELSIQIGIVLGGGNFWRGRDVQDLQLDRTIADSIGMLATISNALVLSNTLEKHSIPTTVFSAKAIPGVVDTFHAGKAKKALRKNHIVFFAGGTGNPFFTTDTTAMLRALEIDADALFKGTKVDGVYDKDPNKYTDAKKYNSLTYEQAIEKDLHALDQTAFSLALQKRIPLCVFNMFEKNNLRKILEGQKIGTIVT